jgi:holdfast attachment protein HfaA
LLNQIAITSILNESFNRSVRDLWLADRGLFERRDVSMAADTIALARAAVALALAAGLGGAAQAQTMIGNSAALNAGYGRVAGSENSPVNVQMRDASGNLVVQNGMIQAGASGSVFASASGALDAASGVGASASAIGNNLTVVTQGDNNTVIVSATQTNTGAVTATTTASGAP